VSFWKLSENLDRFVKKPADVFRSLSIFYEIKVGEPDIFRNLYLPMNEEVAGNWEGWRG
jgi:hypothetical protein